MFEFEGHREDIAEALCHATMQPRHGETLLAKAADALFVAVEGQAQDFEAPFAPFLVDAFQLGQGFTQGGHHVAQKSMRYTEPSNVSCVIHCPLSIDCTTNAGTEWRVVMLSGATIGVCAAA